MRTYLILITVVVLFVRCKERYDVSLPPSLKGYFVVEGLINTNGESRINLSRTTSLDTQSVLFVNNAVVKIEGEDNSSYILNALDSGKYISPFLWLNENIRYRVNIKTNDNREYVSEFVQPIKTPPVDTITWQYYNNGIEIYVNSKDPANNTKYYRWEYEETWQIRSKYEQIMVTKVTNRPNGGVDVALAFYDSAARRRNESVYNCWQSRTSSSIFIGSTDKLSENRVYYPLVYYPRASVELAVLYSINIKQYGLTKEGYDFFYKMKKNTESLGTIFDPMPSEITGNVKCLTDTSEKIIGYIGASTITEKRAFIDNMDLVDWGYYESCTDSAVGLDPDEIRRHLYPAYNFLPTTPMYDPRGNLIGSRIANPFCVDCTLKGTNVRPSYWP
ncbi:MAG: DUF4249 domain-containing protein [Chitinophagaceae bacterium]|nr:DUF4249 domain-containing protein [Chitinophagaceae bacterium]